MNTLDFKNPNKDESINGLSAKDHARLQTFGISLALITTAGIRRVTDAQAREHCGIRYQGNLEGVAFPTFGPSGNVVGWRVRRDHPEEENGRPKNKWIQSQDRPHLYFTPGTRKWINDTSIPIVFVEAYTSALAVDGLCERTDKQFCALATGGCWGWRAQIGIATTEDGTRVPEKGPSPDLDHMAFNDRHVIICFDSNARTNPKVRAAKDAFAKELTRRGADVRIATVPDDSEINGPDDLLAAYGDAALLKILTEAVAMTEPSETARQSLADKIVDLVLNADIELFHRTVDEPYATVEVRGHCETWPILSKGFRRWISRRFWEAYRKAPNAQAIQDALNVLSGKAIHDGPEQAVYVRLAQHGGKLYLDLCNEQWQAVEIASTGWHIVSEVPVKFIRTRGMLPLPLPQKGGTLNDLRSFINVGTDDQWTLIKAWLTAAFRPGYPFIILIVTGEQGSAKSSFQRIIRSLIDPNAAPLRSFPREPRDLMIAASNGWICAFDNISSIPQWLSDDLCRLATGGGFSTRELYSDADERIFDALRPIMLNGIADVATRSDLLDRSIIFNLPMISDNNRRDEEELQASFNALRPKILGALLSHVVGALRTVDQVHLESKPRMADFARFAVAAEIGSGDPSGLFLKYYVENRSGANAVAIEESRIGRHVLSFMENRDEWEGIMGELHEDLSKFVGEYITRTKTWPKTPQSFSTELRRIAPNLRRAGVDVKIGKHGRKGVPLTIQKVGKTSSPSSPSTRPLKVNDLARDEVRDDRQPDSSQPSVANLLNPKAGDLRDERDELFPTLSGDLETFQL